MKKFWLKCLLLALMTQGLYAADKVNKIPEDPNGRMASVLYDNSGRAIATDSSGRLVSSAIGSSVYVTTGTIVNTDTRFAAVSVSSSNSGLITGLTSASIVISDKLYNGSLMFSNVSDVGAYIEITNSIGSGSDYMKDGDSLPIEMYFPTAITFYLKNLPVSSTVQYRFETVK